MCRESKPGSLLLISIAKLHAQSLVFIEQMVSIVLDVGESALFAQQIPFGVLKLGLERILLLPERVIVLDQPLNILQRTLELESERFEFVLVHPQLVSAGFERSRVAEPVVGVFYEVIHGKVLLNTVWMYSNRGAKRERG